MVWSNSDSVVNQIIILFFKSYSKCFFNLCQEPHLYTQLHSFLHCSSVTRILCQSFIWSRLSQQNKQQVKVVVDAKISRTELPTITPNYPKQKFSSLAAFPKSWRFTWMTTRLNVTAFSDAFSLSGKALNYYYATQ